MDENLLAAIPDSELPTWLLGWRCHVSKERGRDYVTAEHAERAKREYEREHPTREVINIYQVEN